MSKEHLGKEINNLFNTMSKERCEIHPVKEKNIITNITGILCTLKRILRVITEILRAEISFAASSVYVFLTIYKSCGLKYHFQPAIKALMIFWP